MNKKTATDRIFICCDANFQRDNGAASIAALEVSATPNMHDLQGQKGHWPTAFMRFDDFENTATCVVCLLYRTERRPIGFAR